MTAPSSPSTEPPDSVAARVAAQPPESVAARVAALSPERRALLARRLAARREASGRGTREVGASGPGATERIERGDPGQAAPVSPAQWRLWFLEQLAPGTHVWNTPVVAAIHGPLDVEALRVALSALVERHSALRTVFRAAGGRPVPALRQGPIDVLTVTDVPPGSPAHRSTEAFVAREVAAPFDLGRDVMLRGAVLRLSPDEHVLVLVAHHIACDGWSKGVLVQELGVLYAAALAGQPPDLAAPALHYADYARWQRRALSPERLRELEGWWREELAGAPTALRLPADRPRAPVPAFRGAVHRLSVPGEVAAPLRAIGREQRATPFMVTLAAFAALLSRHSGQVDLLIGSPSAQRTDVALQRVVGLFANTLVFRARVDPDRSFDRLVADVRTTALGVYAHADLPFERIVHAAAPRRDAGRMPLVQANLRVEGAEPQLELSGCDAELLDVDPGVARFDLGVELGACGDGYRGYFEYDVDLFDAGRTAGWARDLVEVLARCGAEPQAPLRYVLSGIGEG